MISENKFVYALWLADSADVGVEFSKEEAQELARMIDGYLARIAELEAKEIHVEWMSEDKLPEGISDEVFSAMYACSKVDFVRFYPFVTIDGDKRFLIKLPNMLKPCPFCGGKNVLSTELQDGLPFIAYCQCGAENEAENWNTRPIEDDLRKRIAELEAMANCANHTQTDTVVYGKGSGE